MLTINIKHTFNKLITIEFNKYVIFDKFSN